MDVIKQFNNAIAYIENNLCGEIDTNKIAEIALCPYDKFKRFFSYMTNMSVSEYIRKRRLTLAAYELLKEQEKIIDLAVKYGYSNADSFTRAFAKQHGILPTEVSSDTSLKVYPPVSFYVAIKGASELNFKIVDTFSSFVKKDLDKIFKQRYNRERNRTIVLKRNNLSLLPRARFEI